MPGARILTIVTMKFKPAIVELTPTKNIAAHHIEVPGPPWSDIGGYSVQPACGAPIRNDEYSIKPPTGKSQNDSMFNHGKATSRAPICKGMIRLPKPPVSSGMMTSQIIVEP